MKILEDNTYIGPVTELEDDQILVFGSNTEGRHGKGLALLAKNKFGAINGQSHGRQGRCYAIITKDISKHSKRVGPGFIIGQLMDLTTYCRDHKDLKFIFPYMNHSQYLNGYSPEKFAIMVATTDKIIGIPDNLIFEKSFTELYEKVKVNITKLGLY